MPYSKKWNFDEYNWLENYDERMRNTARLRYHETLVIVIGDVMFRNASDNARALAEYPDMEDEYQPILDTFQDVFRDEGFAVEVKQMADTVWIVRAELPPSA